jgi:chemotaxis protein methyltransferase CheR
MTAAVLQQRDFEYVADLVRTEAAIVVEASKRYLVESRLAPVARRHGLDGVGALVARLRAQPRNGLHAEVVEAMTTNETSFFRDVNPFAAMEQEVLPELIRARGAQRQLSIWSAACSSGQEPYSLAMLIRHRFPQLSRWNVRIVASDLSAEMLGRAAAGRYSQMEVNRGLPAPLLVRYFRRDGQHWQIADEVRQMVEFRAMNLIQPWAPLPPLDVVFLRNVLIYFDVATKRQILAQVRRVLRPDGYLFLGAAETTLNVDDAFERVPIGPAVSYRLRERTTS